MAPVIGIDFGTSKSCVVAYENGKYDLVPNRLGSLFTSSAVTFGTTGPIIDEEAQYFMETNVEDVILGVKRLLGRSYDDYHVQNLTYMNSLNVTDDKGAPMITVLDYAGRELAHRPEEISAMILAHLKLTAETYFGTSVRDAVITVPACFNLLQREALSDAASIADLNLLQLLNEPTAVALAYGFNKNVDVVKTILIFNFGAGSFDVSIIKILNGIEFVVKALRGDSWVGGDNFTFLLTKSLALDVETKYQRNLFSDPVGLRRTLLAAEAAKITLSMCDAAGISLPELYEDTDFFSLITTARFEAVCSHLFNTIIENINQTVTDANIQRDALDEIVLIGGSAKIPRIKKILKELFPNTPFNMSYLDRDSVVASGASILASYLSNKQSGRSPIITDMLPKSLGLGFMRNEMSIVVPRGTRIPGRVMRIHRKHNGHNSPLGLYEGEKSSVTENSFLGTISLDRFEENIPIGLYFELNDSGILNVSARDLSNNNDDLSSIPLQTFRLEKRILLQIKLCNQIQQLFDKVQLGEMSRFIATLLCVVKLQKAINSQDDFTDDDLESFRIMFRNAKLWIEIYLAELNKNESNL